MLYFKGLAVGLFLVASLRETSLFAQDSQRGTVQFMFGRSSYAERPKLMLSGNNYRAGFEYVSGVEGLGFTGGVCEEMMARQIGDIGTYNATQIYGLATYGWRLFEGNKLHYAFFQWFERGVLSLGLGAVNNRATVEFDDTYVEITDKSNQTDPVVAARYTIWPTTWLAISWRYMRGPTTLKFKKLDISETYDVTTYDWGIGYVF